MILKVAADGRTFQSSQDLPDLGRPRSTAELVEIGHRAFCPRCLWLGPVRRYTDPEHRDLTDTADTAELDYDGHRFGVAGDGRPGTARVECEPVVVVRFPLRGWHLMEAMFEQMGPMLTAASAMLDPEAVTQFQGAMQAFFAGEIFPAPAELPADELDDDELDGDH